MGELAVKPIHSREEKNRFVNFLLNDMRALEQMLNEKMFEKDRQRIGAEQELALIDEDYNPALNGPEILHSISDEHYTTEIARFNLEINLDPYDLRSDCFRLTERQLLRLLNLGRGVATDFGSNILLTGILPSIRRYHLKPSAMTPRVRYRVLSDSMREIRGADFEIHIEGVDELQATLDSVMFEGCNTSWQTHLQIDPDDFVAQYNWAQFISGPVLSLAVNSPLLLGRELWAETRIALFQQSIDTRNSFSYLREKQRRVRFGHDWIRHSVRDLFEDQIARFPLILMADFSEDALQALGEGQIPSLQALRLHNGTVYTWNRPCYGLSAGGPHLRIENRYMPAGPSVVDELANFAFWVGLMRGQPPSLRDFYHNLSFRIARDNFYRAARNGLNSTFNWFGRELPAQELLLKELLPMARSGLEAARINSADIDRYLGIIEARVRTRQTGARWQLRNFRSLRENFGVGIALNELTRGIFCRQENNEPVHTWKDIDSRHVFSVDLARDTVSKIMATDLYTVGEQEPLALVQAMMKWKRIRHLPVENGKGELVGLITATNLRALDATPGQWEGLSINDVMVREVVTVSPETTIHSAGELMRIYSIGCLPVVVNHKMIGLITETDLHQLEDRDLSRGADDSFNCQKL